MHNDGGINACFVNGKDPTLTVEEILPTRACGLVDGNDIEAQRCSFGFECKPVCRSRCLCQAPHVLVADQPSAHKGSFGQFEDDDLRPKPCLGQASSHCDEGGASSWLTKTALHD